MTLSPECIQLLALLAIAWSADHEARIHAQGHALCPEKLLHAKKAGVRFPEKIRARIVPRIPAPAEGLLGTANEELGFVNEKTAGLTLNYGIYIRQDCAEDALLFFHEFVHVAQYERLGGFEGFLPRYLEECVRLGYHHSPLEIEAVEQTRKFKEKSRG